MKESEFFDIIERELDSSEVKAEEDTPLLANTKES
jgi:hypothetical protein